MASETVEVIRSALLARWPDPASGGPLQWLSEAMGYMIERHIQASDEEWSQWWTYCRDNLQPSPHGQPPTLAVMDRYWTAAVRPASSDAAGDRARGGRSRSQAELDALHGTYGPAWTAAEIERGERYLAQIQAVRAKSQERAALDPPPPKS